MFTKYFVTIIFLTWYRIHLLTLKWLQGSALSHQIASYLARHPDIIKVMVGGLGLGLGPGLEQICAKLLELNLTN